MPDPPLELQGSFDIETPEQVSFRMQRAGIGSRMVACLIDSFILFLLYLALLLVLGVMMEGAAPFVHDVLERMFGEGSEVVEQTALWSLTLWILAMTLLFWFYYIAFESIWNGQTPGKRMLGLRVVRDTGLPVGFGAVLIRNLLRIIDGQFGYAVGLFVIFATREEKRLGDLAAGTILVREHRGAARRAIRFGDPTDRGRTVDPALLDVVRDYFERAGTMDDEARGRVALELVQRLRTHLGRKPRTALKTESELVKLASELLQPVESGATPPPR